MYFTAVADARVASCGGWGSDGNDSASATRMKGREHLQAYMTEKEFSHLSATRNWPLVVPFSLANGQLLSVNGPLTHHIPMNGDGKG